ncbi:RDD family protein [Streptomyces alboflavus]|uniref:RDD family protein n=1 Tax=Streptomyces alboflavus TaxID=67267 RepID=UPI000F656918|nr:RDD family protein [Streptomyces alboflavus]
MSAPTPAPGDDRPREGYYPDPSIPGYVRYWNGVAWVPGTSRPAPSDGEPLPAPPRSATAPPAPAPAATPAEETGPVFFDEEPGGVTQTGPDTDTNIGLGSGLGLGAGSDVDGGAGAGAGAGAGGGDGQHGVKPEPASAWQADAALQTGLGGEQDQRVSWGAAGAAGASGTPGAHGQPDPRDPRDPRVRSEGAAPGAAGAAGGSASEGSARRVPAQQQPVARQEPGQREQAPAAVGRSEDAEADGPGTMTFRAVKPAVPKPATTEGTVTFRRPTGPVKPAGAGTPDADGGTEGTMAIRALRPKSGQPEPASGAAQAPVVPQQAAVPQQAVVPQQQERAPQAGAPQQSAPPQAGVASPVTSGPGGGSASWAQQVHQLAQSPGQGQPGPGDEGPVLPWKPVAADPFAAVVQAQAEARPAGLGRRLAARLIDTVVLAAVTAGAALPLGTRAADHIDSKIDAAKLSGEKVTVWLLDGTTAGYLGVVLGVLLLFGVLYEALPTAKWGRTLGKKVCGVEVRDIEEHGAPSFGAALRRWLVYSVPGVLVVGVVGVLWCLFDRPWRQCWHDKAAGTFVAG